ncbi:MAG: NUDIX domain-containing protein [Sphingobium sp.]|uniref:NUDIX hydrolase n=1 Tax=Sphingobium sp. TaxID=1912891 RepID=UPI0029B4875E|nr:NUDIX domain-containing protein [Sphingobium sp.]MDX3910461.1 NUDIX domain-containing protein [Sphingobium sp.]
MTEAQGSPVTRQAATLIVLREREALAPEILMVKRSPNMAFAADALVFPGGAIDPDDSVVAQSLNTDLTLDEASARVGAIRETLEESGIAPGLSVSDIDVLAELRKELEGGAPFSGLLRNGGMTLDLGALVPFARWHPNAKDVARRVFDARFYLARHNVAGPEPTVDNSEHVDLFWDTAAGVLARCANGSGRVIFPTRRNLERVAQFSSIAALEQHARTIAVEKIVPWIEHRPGGEVLCIPNHLGYPICEEPIETAMRG